MRVLTLLNSVALWGSGIYLLLRTFNEAAHRGLFTLIDAGEAPWAAVGVGVFMATFIVKVAIEGRLAEDERLERKSRGERLEIIRDEMVRIPLPGEPGYDDDEVF